MNATLATVLLAKATNPMSRTKTSPYAKTEQTKTAPQDIDTDALFNFITPVNAYRTKTVSSLIMSAYLKLRF